MVVCANCLDKYIAWFKREGVRICVEIYRYNQCGESISFGKLYEKFRFLFNDSELSNLLMLMEEHEVIRDEWKLENSKWIKNIFITPEFIPELQEINKLRWD
jgi:hypothetical protein